ncbi:MAG: galactokinase [Blastocatellia bacterium]|nr:galactokinase [Blastocatellia bacterium]
MEKELENLAGEFGRSYSSTPRFFQAPGRVNLIGEHTDYNDGFVMPFAIDRRVLVAASGREDSKITARALDVNDAVSIDLADAPEYRRGSWVDYVEGTARCIAKRFGPIRGADLMFTSTVPSGAGLSSSAAIEIAIGTALLTLSELEIDGKLLAFAAQEAEHEYVGIRSGIMDQFVSVFGKSRNAMLLDCRSLDLEYIPIVSGDTAIAVIDTNVKHNLAATEYNTRRRECEMGVEILAKNLPGIRSLRDVAIEDLDEHGNLLAENIRRRCRHVISENDRTIAAASALRRSDIVEAGRLMFESHRSLRDDYEVSCPELDCLVDVASAVTGVHGARMTGGGFGGCTVNLVDRSSINELRASVVEKYQARFGILPDFYLFEASDGASEIFA